MLSLSFKRAHIKLLVLGVLAIIGASAYCPYTYDELFGMFVSDRVQLLVIHVLANFLISVILLVITWHVNRLVLEAAFYRIGIQNQLRFTLRYFWVYGLISILAPLLMWLHTILGNH